MGLSLGWMLCFGPLFVLMLFFFIWQVFPAWLGWNSCPGTLYHLLGAQESELQELWRAAGMGGGFARIHWVTRRGHWRQLLPLFSAFIRDHPPPQVLAIHQGGDDLVQTLTVVLKIQACREFTV